ncbi:hypothetical protein JD76_04141 [Micromonospora endolithica]|nr:hypothetical protein JD76_04141 [Micromonospora endolithica]
MLAAALLVPGMAACNKSESADPAASASATPADPKEALRASTKELGQGNFTFTMTGAGLTGKGLVHKPSNSVQFDLTFDDGSGSTMGMEMIMIESDSWVKMDLGELADSVPAMAKLKDKYQHIDKTKIKDSDALAVDLENPDPAGADALFKSITDVQETGKGTYAGKLDVSGVTDSGAIDSDVIKSLGDQAKALPFTAKLDDQGRLAELTMPIPAAGETKAHEIKVTYADYGKATGAQKPPADKVIEASPETYEMFQ